MAEKKTYTGIRELHLHSSDIVLKAKKHPFRPWRDFFRNIDVEKMGGTIWQENGSLHLKNCNGEVSLPASRRIALGYDQDSKLGGIYPGGSIKGERINLESAVSYEMPKHPLLSSAKNTARDAFSIAGISSLTLTSTLIAERVLGVPQGEWSDIGLLVAAGSYVGVWGRNMGSFARSSVLAGALIFGPEVYEGVMEGTDAFYSSLGFEDLGKAGLYGASWMLGNWGRNWYNRMTD